MPEKYFGFPVEDPTQGKARAGCAGVRDVIPLSEVV
jgi:hypothetical protein